MLPRTFPARIAALVVLSGLFAGAGCNPSDDSSSASTTTTTVPSACAAEKDEKPAKALLRCAEGSIAFVENQDASGTGVVIEHDDKRYVLTNAHVVDPFDTADVTVDGTSIPGLPVVGIDAGADIAVVGPITGKDQPVALTVSTDVELERGDDVYLVGFPGEVMTDDPDDLEVTIASGIVSRIREVKEFEQTYLQTDASIAGGQSGGPLFDSAGDLVGISGLSFAEEFALALSGADVDDAVQRILAGDGDDYPNVPRVDDGDDERLVESGTVTITDAADRQELFIPASDEDRELDFNVDVAANPVITFTSNMSDDPIGISSNYLDVSAEVERILAGANGGSPDDLPDPAAYGVDEKATKAETAPGVFHLDIESEFDTYISIEAPLTNGPIETTFESSLPVFALTAPPTTETIEVGDTVDRVISTYEGRVEYLLDLEEGQEVEIRAESAQSDLAIEIIDPDVVLTPAVLADPDSVEGIAYEDDSDEGLYGLDAVTTFTADVAGTYRVRLYSNEFLTVLARLSINET